MRLGRAAVTGGTLVAVLGVAGLVRAAVPQSSPAAADTTAYAPIVVSGAYVRAPVPPTRVAAAYFTVTNNSATAARLIDVSTGAGPSAVLHVDQPDGSMAAVSGGVTIPAHGSLTLSTGRGHVMIEDVYPSVKAGQSVNIDLEFDNAAPVEVLAPVIAFGAAAPTGSATPQGGHS